MPSKGIRPYQPGLWEAFYAISPQSKSWPIFTDARTKSTRAFTLDKGIDRGHREIQALGCRLARRVELSEYPAPIADWQCFKEFTHKSVLQVISSSIVPVN